MARELDMLPYAWLGDPLLRRGWQHDGRWPMNPAKPGPRPQKVPDSLL